MKHKYITLTLFTSFLFAACTLEVPLLDKISGLDAVDSPETAREVLNGGYSKYPKTIFLEFSMLAEDFYLTEVSDPEKEESYKLYNWNHETIKNTGDALWREYYDALKQVNIVLAAEKNMPVNNEDWPIIKGEAYALKALIYYDLLQIFSDRFKEETPGCILRDEYDSKPRKRTSTKECLEEILKNIDIASDLLRKKEKESYYYIDYLSTLVIKARTLLYSQQYELIPPICNEILDSISYEGNIKNKVAYENLWQSQSSVNKYRFSEKLFAFDNQEFTHRLDPFWVNEKLGDIIAVNSAFDYQEKDIRKGIASFDFEIMSATSDDTLRYNLLGKYRRDVTDRVYHNINAIRLAEIYFILAESLIELGQYSQAIEVLNRFLEARGADLVSTTINSTALKEKMRFEKQKEFVGEGINFFDLKRWGKDIKRFVKSNPNSVSRIMRKSDYRFTLPLSLQEIRHSDGLATQNNGWTNIH